MSVNWVSKKEFCDSLEQLQDKTNQEVQQYLWDNNPSELFCLQVLDDTLKPIQNSSFGSNSTLMDLIPTNASTIFYFADKHTKQIYLTLYVICQNKMRVFVYSNKVKEKLNKALHVKMAVLNSLEQSVQKNVHFEYCDDYSSTLTSKQYDRMLTKSKVRKVARTANALFVSLGYFNQDLKKSEAICMVFFFNFFASIVGLLFFSSILSLPLPISLFFSFLPLESYYVYNVIKAAHKKLKYN
ncbi:MAG: hypothetical protein ACRCXZ_01805 [Patescibacteria group bacterium]